MHIEATMQTTRPPRAFILATDMPAGGRATILRLVDEKTAIVRGLVDLESSADVLTGVDAEQPLNTPYRYRVVHVADDGTETEADSLPVTATSRAPWLSDPLTGRGIQTVIESWTELERSARQSVIGVSGTPWPAVMADVHMAPSSEVVLSTRTRTQLDELRAMVMRGRTLLLRTGEPAVEDAYLRIGAIGETRQREHKPDSWDRLVSLDVQEVPAPPALLGSVGDTLEDLHEYVGGEDTTLAYLHSVFGPNSTLLDIAATQLVEELS